MIDRIIFMSERAECVKLQDSATGPAAGRRLFPRTLGGAPAGRCAHQGLPCPRRPGEAATADGWTVLRSAPRLAWVIGEPGDPPDWRLDQDGVVVALSSSRMRICLRRCPGQLLSRLVAVDLGDGLPPGAFTASMIHGAPVTIVHAEGGVDLLVPRSLHASLLEWIEDAGRGLAAAANRAAAP